MADDREQIFARLRESLERLTARTPYPDFPADAATPASRRAGGHEVFRERLAACGTRILENLPALSGYLRERRACFGYCDPSLMTVVRAGLDPDIELSDTFDRRRMDDYDFGITRASGGIIETGSLILTDRDTSDRLGAVAPWIHVACLDPARLYATLADAIAALGDDPNVILVSGHSQTADVEGIMIHGVHGPGEQICLLAEGIKNKRENDP